MATNLVEQKVGTQIMFNITGSFSPADAATNWIIGSPTNVVLTQSALANGAGRQSTKFDFGATRAAAYECLAAVDFTDETPVAGNTVDYYLAPSTIVTAGSGNVAGNSGVDAAAPGGALGSITLAEFIEQCIYIGSLKVHDGAVVQNGFVGVVHPTSRWGQLIVVNNSGDAFEADDVENHVVLNPIVDEIAAAV
jgi:hypothetical protein